MRSWQFDVAFVVCLALLVFFAVAPYFGLDAAPNPLVVAAFGALTGYVFTRRDDIKKDGDGHDG